MEDILTEFSDRLLAAEHRLSIVEKDNKRLNKDNKRLTANVEHLTTLISTYQQQQLAADKTNNNLQPSRVPVARKAQTKTTLDDPVGAASISSKKKRDLYTDEEDIEEDDDDDDTVASDDSSYYEPSLGAAKRKKTKSDTDKKKNKGGKKKAKTTSSSARMTEYFLYRCPVTGCDCEFSVPGYLYPPLDDQGFVTDRVKWPANTLRYYQQKARIHMRKDHPNVPEATWPPGFATSKVVGADTNSAENGSVLTAGDDPAPAPAAQEQESKVNHTATESTAKVPLARSIATASAVPTSAPPKVLVRNLDPKPAVAKGTMKMASRVLAKYPNENQRQAAQIKEASPNKPPSKPPPSSPGWDSDCTFII